MLHTQWSLMASVSWGMLRVLVNILVMCDCYTPSGDPIATNKRCNAAKIFSHPDVHAEETWYGIEQEYIAFAKECQVASWMAYWWLSWTLRGHITVVLELTKLLDAI